MDLAAIQKAYARWAPHYDLSFGKISDRARHYTVSKINKKPGRVLEVGVGTGLSLPLYAPDMRVCGVDISVDMLQRADKRAKEAGLRNIETLEVQDARAMSYEDNAFDTVTAMYIMSVVPEPEKVMREIARVVKPDGDVFILNHFSSDNGFIAFAEKAFAPVCRVIGWHSEFAMETVTGASGLKLVKIEKMSPFGIFSLLHFKKRAE